MNGRGKALLALAMNKDARKEEIDPLEDLGLHENYYNDSNASAHTLSTSDNGGGSSSNEQNTSTQDICSESGPSSEIPETASERSDFYSDDFVVDRDYIPPEECEDSDEMSANETAKEPSLNDTYESVDIFVSAAKKGFKRKAFPEKWKRNVKKQLRNEGKAYEMVSKVGKIRKPREMKQPCGEKCRLKCSSKITEETRKTLFDAYWSLGSLERQRQFIKDSISPVQPKYRYIRIGGINKPRDMNSAFNFKINDGYIRVCKMFYRNTLDITDRNIRTVIQKKIRLLELF